MTTRIYNAELGFDGGPLSGFRNRLINGDFRIQQRTSSGAVGAYLLDRWYQNFAGSAVTQSQGGAGLISNGATSFYVPSSYVLTGATGNTALNLYQRVERINMIDMVGQTVTLSYWVFQSTGTTMNVTSGFVYPTANDNYTSSTNIGSTAAVAVPNGTWTKVVGAIAIPTAATTGLQVTLLANSPALVAGQGITIANVQLEVGSVVTPFEQRLYGTELALCQRYYAQGTAGLIGTQFTATNVARAQARLPVSMRTGPTLTLSNTAQFFNGSTTSTATGTLASYSNADYWQADVTVGTVTLIQGSCCSMIAGSGTWTATAEL